MKKKELRQFNVELRVLAVLTQYVCVDAYTKAEARALAPKCSEPEWDQEMVGEITVEGLEDVGPA